MAEYFESAKKRENRSDLPTRTGCCRPIRRDGKSQGQGGRKGWWLEKTAAGWWCVQLRRRERLSCWERNKKKKMKYKGTVVYGVVFLSQILCPVIIIVPFVKLTQLHLSSSNALTAIFVLFSWNHVYDKLPILDLLFTKSKRVNYQFN